jgi:hypothetical protein
MRRPVADDEDGQMAFGTYYVALAFKRSEDGGKVVACQAKEMHSAAQAIQAVASLATRDDHCGAIAFSRTANPYLGKFQNAVILKTIGDVNVGLLTV